MRTLQLWLPLFGRSLGFADAARDTRYALERWDCDHRIWILPSLKESIIRWTEKWPRGAEMRMCAVRGEALDCLDIYHIGENGVVYGIPQCERFPNWRVDGLLDAWLDWHNTDSFRWQSPPKIFVDVPEVIGEEIGYRRTEYRPPMLPVQETGVSIPLSGTTNSGVTSDAEAAQAYRQRYGALRLVDRGELPPVIISEQDENFRAVGAVLWAPEPLELLFPVGVSLDALYHHARMLSVAHESGSNPQRALQRAYLISAPYLSTGTTTRAFTWFMPALFEVQDMQAVVGRGATLQLNDARAFGDLKVSEQWRQQMTEYMPVRRAWGPIGLLWALLIDRLEAGQPLRICGRCGKPLQGIRTKQFCGPEDRPDCYKARRKSDRQRERDRERIGGKHAKRRRAGR